MRNRTQSYPQHPATIAQPKRLAVGMATHPSHPATLPQRWPSHPATIAQPFADGTNARPSHQVKVALAEHPLLASDMVQRAARAAPAPNWAAHAARSVVNVEWWMVNGWVRSRIALVDGFRNQVVGWEFGLRRQQHAADDHWWIWHAHYRLSAAGVFQGLDAAHFKTGHRRTDNRYLTACTDADNLRLLNTLRAAHEIERGDVRWF